MKIRIDRAALLKALTRVQSVVERRNTIPILGNVLLRAEGDHLRLVAADQEMEVVDSADAEIERAGAITTPAHMFFDIIRKFPEGAEIRLETLPDRKDLMIFSGRSRFQLATLPADDFPNVANERFPTRFTVPAAALARLAAKTRFAISTEETRYYLNGVFLHVANGTDDKLLRAVATDGHRLALAEMPAPEGSESMPAIIVPRKTIQEMMRLLQDVGEEVEMFVSESRIRFESGRIALMSKLIEGSFPDYARVIPRGNRSHLKVENQGFAAAVDRVATVSAERSRSVKMAVDDGKVVVTVNHPESGLATEEIYAETPAEPLEIGFNARYLLDVCEQIEGEDALFEFGDAGGPALVRDSGDSSSLFVLMPLRV